MRMGRRGGIRAKRADEDNEDNKFRTCKLAEVAEIGGKVRESYSQLEQATMAEGDRKVRVEREEAGRTIRNLGNQRNQEDDNI